MATSRHPDAWPRSRLSQNLQCRVTSVLWVSTSVSASYAGLNSMLIHIPWLASCNRNCLGLVGHKTTDRQCDIQSMANMKIIFVICALTFSTLSKHKNVINYYKILFVAVVVSSWSWRLLSWSCSCSRSLGLCVSRPRQFKTPEDWWDTSLIIHNSLSLSVASFAAILSEQQQQQQQQQRPFNGLWSGTTRVGQYQKKHSPTHTHLDQRASFITFLHVQRSMASSLFNLHAWQSSHTTSFQVFPLVLNPQLHTPSISSPSHRHLFATHDRTSAACSAAILMLCHLPLVSLSAPYLGVYLLA